MSKGKRKKNWILVLLGLAALLILGFPFAYQHLVHSCLKNYCKKKFGGDLVYDYLERLDGRWVFNNPKIVNAKKLGDSGAHFHAEKLHIEPSFRLFDRTIDLEVILEKPIIGVERRAADLRSLISKENYFPSLGKVNTSLAIKDGQLILHDRSSGEISKHPFLFDLEFTQDQSTKASLSFKLGGEELERNLLSLAAEETDKDEVKLDLLFDNLACRPAFEVLKTVFPAGRDWQIEEGVINGNLSVSLPSNEKSYVQGALLVSDLKFSNAPAEISGLIQEAKLEITEPPQQIAVPGNIRMIGTLEFSESMSLAILNGGKDFFKIDGLLGSISVHPDKGAEIGFAGKCSHHGSDYDLSIEGNAMFSKAEQPSIEVGLTLSGGESPDVQAFLVCRQLGSMWNLAEIDFNNIGPSELDLLQAGLGERLPSIKNITITSGSLDASLVAYLKGWSPAELKLNRIAGKNLTIRHGPWNMEASVGSLYGGASFNLYAVDPFSTLNGNMILTNGNLKMAGAGNNSWQLADLHADLTVQKGKFHKSTVNGIFAGLKGGISLDSNESQDPIRLNFQGNTLGIAKVIPAPLQSEFIRLFGNDTMAITAGVRETNSGMGVKGTLELKGVEAEANAIHFQFDVEKTSQALWGKWPIDEIGAAIVNNSLDQIAHALLPSIAAPAVKVLHEALSKEAGMYGFLVRNGKFEAHGLPLSKFLAPLFFKGNQVAVAGTGDFKGTFDQRKVFVQYNVKDLSLENQDFLFTVSELKSKESFPASYYFDLLNGANFGSIPISNGVFKDKTIDLEVKDIQADVLLESDRAHWENMQAYCKGILFAGRMDVNAEKMAEGKLDVDIKAHTMQGKAHQVREMFSHFKRPFLFLKLPIEGDIVFRNKGAHINFSFDKDQCNLKSKIEGALTNATAQFDDIQMLLKNLSFNFDFDNEEHVLNLTDIHGIGLMGPQDQKETYTLSGEHILIADYINNQSKFDLWVSDSSRDLIRIAGHTNGKRKEDGDFIDIHLNPSLSHFGDIHPQEFVLTVKDLTQIDSFHFKADIRLHTFMNDLYRFSQTGLWEFTRMSKNLKALDSISGLVVANVSFNGNDGLLTYEASGSGLAINNHSFQDFFLSGKKKGNIWTIDQLTLDDMSFSADLLKLNKKWKVNFLGARLGKSILVGLEGEYQEGAQSFEAKVNLLEADLEHLAEWPSLRAIASEYNPKGVLKASGQAKFELIKENPGWRVEALATTSLRGWGFKGFAFQDVDKVSCHYLSDKGITWRHAVISLKDTNTAASKDATIGRLELEKAEYNLAKQEGKIENLKFNFPAEHLKVVASMLGKGFPDSFPLVYQQTLADAKTTGNFEGTLSFERNPKNFLVRLNLKEGAYHFFNRDHDLNNFVLEYDPYEFKVLTQYLYRKHLFWILGRSTDPELESGELIMADNQPETQPHTPGKPPLLVKWHLHPTHGFIIDRAEGNLAGISAFLRADPKRASTAEALYLSGEVRLNFPKAAPLLSEEIAAGIPAWGLGDGYTFRGKWKLDKNSQLENNFSFQGTLLGNDFLFNGYQLDTLIALLDYTPNSIKAKNISIEDPAGALFIEQVDIQKDKNEDWYFLMPKAYISNFRPSLLREAGGMRTAGYKPLTFKEIQAEKVSGMLSDSRTILGRGRLSFINPHKKNLQNTIFAIPAEILTMIGLDLAVLTPVTGQIYFDLKDGRIFLTKFKDIYSDGKMSKFNLPSTGEPSWIDYKGNLHVHVRMKQYNLIFKLAELFTVSINGTFTKPKYSLQKHSRLERSNITEKINGMQEPEIANSFLQANHAANQ